MTSLAFISENSKAFEGFFEVVLHLLDVACLLQVISISPIIRQYFLKNVILVVLYHLNLMYGLREVVNKISIQSVYLNSNMLCTYKIIISGDCLNLL